LDLNAHYIGRNTIDKLFDQPSKDDGFIRSTICLAIEMSLSFWRHEVKVWFKYATNIRQSDRFILKRLLRQTAFHILTFTKESRDSWHIRNTCEVDCRECCWTLLYQNMWPSSPASEKTFAAGNAKYSNFQTSYTKSCSGSLKSDTKQTEIKEKE
jgi:hypothetical protein